MCECVQRGGITFVSSAGGIANEDPSVRWANDDTPVRLILGNAAPKHKVW
ncbi:MAG: hypothetical protein AAFU85_20950 [Planctomycetota bacterium]